MGHSGGLGVWNSSGHPEGTCQIPFSSFPYGLDVDGHVRVFSQEGGTPRAQDGSPLEAADERKSSEGFRVRWLAKKPRKNLNSWLSSVCSACEGLAGTQGKLLHSNSIWYRHGDSGRLKTSAEMMRISRASCGKCTADVTCSSNAPQL